MSTNTIYIRQQNFLKKADIVHNFRYTYPEINYINARSKVDIHCEHHGIFTQTPSSHLSGAGCMKCRYSDSSRTKTTTKFIKEAKRIHDNLYIYLLSSYTNAHTPLQIECKSHGIFLQSPTNHLQGQGCVKCSNDNKTGRITKKDSLDSQDIYYVYTIKMYNEYEEFFKTGISKSYNNRHKDFIRTGYNVEIIDIMVDTKYNCFILEQKLLKKRQRVNKYTPQVKFGGSTECYTL